MKKIVAIVLSLLLKLPDTAKALKGALMQDFTLSEQSIKDTVQKIIADSVIVKRLTDIVNGLNNVTESLKEDVEKHDTLNPKL